MDVVGYSSSWSIPTGGQLNVHVSSRMSKFHASLVRLQQGDPNPEGPGVKEFPVQWDGEGEYHADWHGIPSGSYMAINHFPSFVTGTLALWIKPALLMKCLQTIAATADWRIVIDPEGAIHFVSPFISVRSANTLRPGEWTHVVVRWTDSAADIGIKPKVNWPSQTVPIDATSTIKVIPGKEGTLVFAAKLAPDGISSDHFTGKLADLRLYDRWLADGVCPGFIADGEYEPAAFAHWSMTDDPSLMIVEDVCGHHAAILHQMPVRGVTGPFWDGSHQRWYDCPPHYGAIAFNAEDKIDARWPVAFTLHLPEHCQSDVYAIKLSAGETVDHVPFFVRAQPGQQQRVLFLAPTFSYLAYGNEHTAAHYIRTMPQIAEHNRQSINPYPSQAEQRFILETGLNSLYDVRADGQGYCYASTRLPLLNFRPHTKFQMLDNLQGGAHQFMADLFIVDWLQEKNILYDVATDHDLHRDGVALLDQYDVVITGTHHEYVSFAELDAVAHYVENGGKLMYMSGNGFYWVTSQPDGDDTVIEVRRAHGTGAWTVAAGERHHATTGEQGGLWKDRGRPPQTLVGVGFVADSLSGNAVYEVQAVAGGSLAEHILMRAGLEAGDMLGDEKSLVMGPGAAGFEVDRIDATQGSPLTTTCLASARMPESYVLAVEEIGSHSHLNLTSAGNNDVRADCALVEYPNGGAVFATGSINWSGCLSAQQYQGSISRLTEAALLTFLSAAPARDSSPN